MTVVRNAARSYLEAGLSVVPVRRDKRPAVVDGETFAWRRCQEVRLSAGEADHCFARSEGVAVVAGSVSGQVECLDFDDGGSQYDAWCSHVVELGFSDALMRCCIEQTPSGGWHVIYRRPPGGEDTGKAKLARTAEGRTLIERLGEGAYFLCHPTPGYVPHQGSLADLPVLPDKDRDALVGAARLLDQTALKTPAAQRAGDEFAKSTTWADILEPHGWTLAGMRGETGLWCRPGKTPAQGIGATTNALGTDRLHVFTTSTVLEPTSYSKFGALTALRFNGDHRKAAEALRREGYGRPTEPEPQIYVTARATKVRPDYLLEPYLQRGKMTLLDADGGVGKTCFVMALAAGGSQGFFAPIGEVEPFRTLYYGREDEISELETVYYACGGQPGGLAMVEDNFPLNGAGLRRVERDIRKFRPGLVVFDPLIAFLDGRVSNINDPLPINRMMDELARLFAQTGAAAINLRHTRKTQMGQVQSEAGMGSVQFRNRHRSQLCLRFHRNQTENPGLVVMEHLKGSLLSPLGRPILFRRVGNTVEFITQDRAKPMEAAKTFLTDRLTNGGARAAEIYEEGAKRGLSASTLRRARLEMNIGSRGSTRHRVWFLPETTATL